MTVPLETVSFSKLYEVH